MAITNISLLAIPIKNTIKKQGLYILTEKNTPFKQKMQSCRKKEMAV